ncbi:MAG: hypothetical protein ACRDPW_04835 [Mycobacteriales bacterium]
MTLLLLVGALGAAGGAAICGVAREATTQSYTAAAVFSVDNIAPEMQFLSFSKAIEAEQVVRVLADGRTGEIVPAGASTYEWEWVVGPKAGEVSFEVQSNDRSDADRLAAVLFAAAGPAGRALLAPDQPQPGLTPERVTPAAARYRLGAQTPALGAALGAGTAMSLFVLGMFLLTDRTPRSS